MFAEYEPAGAGRGSRISRRIPRQRSNFSRMVISRLSPLLFCEHPLCANTGLSPDFGFLILSGIPIMSGALAKVLRCRRRGSSCAKAGRSVPNHSAHLHGKFPRHDGASDADDTPNVRTSLLGDGRCDALANFSACPGRLARPPSNTIDPRGHAGRRARDLDHLQRWRRCGANPSSRIGGF